METSAKAGHNVKGLFKKIAMSLPGMEKENQSDTNTSAFPAPMLPLDYAFDTPVLQKLTSQRHRRARCPRHLHATVDMNVHTPLCYHHSTNPFWATNFMSPPIQIPFTVH